MDNVLITYDKRGRAREITMSCLYYQKGKSCMYCDNDTLECTNSEALRAAGKQNGYFGPEPELCHGYYARLEPLKLTKSQERSFWLEHEAAMLKEIYQNRAAIRQTLSAMPQLIADDCPAFLLPPDF